MERNHNNNVRAFVLSNANFTNTIRVLQSCKINAITTTHSYNGDEKKIFRRHRSPFSLKASFNRYTKEEIGNQLEGNSVKAKRQIADDEDKNGSEYS